jgi:hypothetical protein
MKLKLSLLAVLLSAGLFAADAPAPGAPAPDAPPRGKGGFRAPPGVTEEEFKKYNDARKEVQNDPAVKEAVEKAKEAQAKIKDAKDDDAKKAAFEEAAKARNAVREATNAAIIKKDPTLADVVKKIDEAMKNRGGKGGKGGKGKDAPPADAPAPAAK